MGSALPARESRFHPVDKPPKFRTEGERDSDRVLYSEAFARLDGVTQVSLAEEGQLFHNRLTHSLKVSQVGRRLAEKLLRVDAQEAGASDTVRRLGGLDPSVVEAACLAHDLGHPPFGHIGEQALDSWVRDPRRGILDGFEGNAQSFRIVNALGYAVQGARGLNLTAATLNAVLKYPWPWADGRKKWGFYQTEREQFEWARSTTELGDNERSLEARLMDWADDITYAVHDVEDYYRAGFIPLPSISQAVLTHPDGSPPDLDPIWDQVRADWVGQPEFPELDEDKMKVAAKGPIGLFPLTGTFQGTRSERASLLNWSSYLIGRLVESTSITAADLIIREEALIQVDVLKAFTKVFVIGAPNLKTQQVGERRIIHELLDTYWSSLHDENTGVLPLRIQEDASLAIEQGLDAVVRLVADTVAEMTESEALRMFGRFTGSGLGSVMEPPFL